MRKLRLWDGERLSQGEAAEVGFQASSVHPASSLHTPCFALTEINLLNRTGLIIEGSLKAGPAVPSVAQVSKWAAQPRAVHANELDQGPLQVYWHWQPGQWPALTGPRHSHCSSANRLPGAEVLWEAGTGLSSHVLPSGLGHLGDWKEALDTEFQSKW